MTVRMTGQKTWIWPAAILAIVSVATGFTIRARDADIQADRDASALLISEYEQRVKKADQELRTLESQIIALNDLALIANLQIKALQTSKQLIALAPIIKHPNKVDTNSKESVDLFLNSAQSYQDKIVAYQAHMASLNSIVDRANKQYVIKAVRPSFLDRSTLSSRRKFAEIIGLAQTPILAPSAQVEAINQGIAERSKKQETIRSNWNNQAAQIKTRNRDVNALLDEVYRLYKTTKGGIKIARANDVKTVN